VCVSARIDRAGGGQSDGTTRDQARSLFCRTESAGYRDNVALGHAPAFAQSVGLSTDSSAAPADLTRLDYPLERTVKRVAASAPIKIIAIGSSSTAGAPARAPRPRPIRATF
jgi:hypothetical protein